MSSHHHHHQQSIQHCHNANSQCCCCSSSSSCLSCSSSSSPSLDQQQLLQALASQLLLLHSSPPPPPKAHLHRQYQHKSSRSHLYHAPQAQAQTEAQAVLHSLFQRVAALESYLPHLSSVASAAAADPPLRTPPPRPQTPVAPPPPPHPSLREVAARTIQAQFRLFLVRRSQTLRHLQHLASIKSRAAALRSSLSDRAPAAASQEATDLLLQLDSIQSRDPMIREGKRSIGRELNRIMEFIDKVSLRDHRTVLEAIKLADNGGHRRRAKPSSTKRVSFAQDVNGRRGFRGIGDYSRVLEDPEEMHQLSEEDEEEEEECPRENGVRLGIKKRFEGQNGNLGLSPPVPVHMEPRES